VLKRTPGPNELDVSAILHDKLVLLQLRVLVPVDVREAPLLGDNDLLSSRELVAGTTESLLDNRRVRVLAADRQDDLSDVDASDGAVRLAPSATHTGLKSISTGTGQHLVDADDVVRVDTDTHVERILAGNLRHILVRANAGSFERLARQLFVLVRHQVAAEGEIFNGSTLAAQVEDTDLRIWDTTVVPRLRVRLVLAVAVAASGAATHLVYSTM